MTSDGHLSFRPTRLSPRPLYGALLIAWVFILVVVVVFLVMLGVERAEGEFEERAGELQSELTARLKFNDLTLNGFAAFLAVADRDERNAITHYATAILRQTPHIHSLGVVEEVKAARVENFLREMRRAGYPGIAIRDFEPDSAPPWPPAPPRPVYYPLSMIVSLDGQHDELLGLDMGHIKIIHVPLLEAMKDPGAYATEMFDLPEGGRGYAVFRRIESAIPTSTIQSRSLAILVVRTADLLPDSVTAEEYEYHISIVAQENHSRAATTLFDHPSRPDNWFASLLLPTLRYSRSIDDTVPPVTFTIERRLTWKDVNFPVIAWVMFAATLTLLLLHVYMSAHRNSEARRMELENLLQYKAHHDELTDLPNRTLIIDRLEQGIRNAQRDKQPMAVLFLDLDGFKPVNDTYGHEAGDRVLREVAQRFRTVVRDRDTVGRMSGDEFIMILADTDRDGCKVVIDKIESVFDATFTIDAQTKLKMGVSIGIAIYPVDGATPGELMRIADNDMYRHKLGRKLTLGMSS